MVYKVPPGDIFANKYGRKHMKPSHQVSYDMRLPHNRKIPVRNDHTAIPYRASTGPEQGFPCEVFNTGKNLFPLQDTPVLIAGTPVFITGISL